MKHWFWVTATANPYTTRINMQSRSFVTNGLISHILSELSIELVSTNDPQFDNASEVTVSLCPLISTDT